MSSDKLEFNRHKFPLSIPPPGADVNNFVEIIVSAILVSVFIILGGNPERFCGLVILILIQSWPLQACLLDFNESFFRLIAIGTKPAVQRAYFQLNYILSLQRNTCKSQQKR